jgi:sec-independent protein translocase protein TatC
VAAVVTPTPDPFNLMLVATPLLILYGLGILLSRFA